MEDEKEILTIKNLNNIKLDNNNEENVKDDEEYSDNHEINININSFLVNNNITEKEANKNFEKLFGKRKFYDYMLYTQPRYHEGKKKVSSMWCVLTCILDAYIILYGGGVAKLRDIFVKILQTEYKIKCGGQDKNCTNFKWDFSAPFNILYVNKSGICIKIEGTKTSKDEIKSIGQKVKDEKKGVEETIKKIITKIIKMTNIQKLAIVNLSSSATSQYWVYKKDDSLKFINLSNGKEIKKPMLILDIIKKIESWYNIEDKYINEIVKTKSNSIQMKSFKDIKKSDNIDKNIFNSKNWLKIDMQEIKKEFASCFKCFENYNEKISKITKMNDLATVTLNGKHQCLVYKSETGELQLFNPDSEKPNTENMPLLDRIEEVTDWLNIQKG